MVVDHLIVKATYSPCFLLNAYKGKLNNNYEGTAALELHRYHNNFGATPCYKREKQKTVADLEIQKGELCTGKFWVAMPTSGT